MEQDDLILRRVAAAYFTGDEVIPCGEAQAAIEIGLDRLCAKGFPSPAGHGSASPAAWAKFRSLDTPGCGRGGPLEV